MMGKHPIHRFRTDRHVEVPAVTAEQMREIDRVAVEECGPNLFQMMENAGRNLASMAIETVGADWATARIVVLAGTGGNGGGGICGARHLANRGVDVRLCLTDASRLGEVPGFQRRVYQGTAGFEVAIGQLDRDPVDLILDAVIGYGLEDAPRGVALELIEWANASRAPILSLDVPSGIDSTSGAAAGAFVRAHRTMTLALPKTGLRPERTGDLVLSDLGIPAAVFRRLDLEFSSPFDGRFRVPLAPI